MEKYGFYLAGGTAIAIQLKHRQSIDLNWFTPQDIEPDVLSTELQEVGLEITDISISTGTLHTRLGVSFMEYKYPMIKELISYDLGFKMASLVDIGLMKVTAIADRGTKKDFTDICFIAKKLGGLYRIMESFAKKYEKVNEYHFMKSLTYFYEADEMPDLEMLIDLNWDEIKKYIRKESLDWEKRNNFY